MAAGAASRAESGDGAVPTLQSLSLDLLRIATALARLGARAGDTLSACPHVAPARALAERRARAAAFGRDLTNPGWTLLLILYEAHLAAPSPHVPSEVEGPADESMRIRRLVAASGVPVATTFRWLARLETAGLLERRPDPSHERGVLVSLTPKGVEAMDWHFATLGDA